MGLAFQGSGMKNDRLQREPGYERFKAPRVALMARRRARGLDLYSGEKLPERLLKTLRRQDERRARMQAAKAAQRD
jgi:hypothetical protein